MTLRRETLKNNPVVTILDGGIDNSQTTLDVIDGSVFPSTGSPSTVEFRILVEDEIMLVTARSTNTLTVVRGVEGTAAASHADALDVSIPMTEDGFKTYLRDSVPFHGSSQPPHRNVDASGEPLTSADWTWVNQDGSSVSDDGQTITLTRPTKGSGEHASLLVRSAPGTPYTVTAGFRLSYICGSAFVAGVVMRESGTGKFTTLRWLETGSGLPGIRMTNYTDPNNVSSSPTLLATVMPGDILWMKMEDNATNLIFYISNDGIHWVKYYTVSRTSFMAGGPDQIGFYCDAVNSDDNSYATLVHWNEGA